MMIMMTIIMMMEIPQFRLFLIHHLKIYEYTSKNKFYMMYEMYNDDNHNMKMMVITMVVIMTMMMLMVISH